MFKRRRVSDPKKHGNHFSKGAIEAFIKGYSKGINYKKIEAIPGVHPDAIYKLFNVITDDQRKGITHILFPSYALLQFPIRSKCWMYTSLTFIDLSCSYITRLPIDICFLPQLEELNLSNTCLDSLPEYLDELPNLRKLDISHTPIARDYAVYYERDEVLRFFRSNSFINAIHWISWNTWTPKVHYEFPYYIRDLVVLLLCIHKRKESLLQ